MPGPILGLLGRLAFGTATRSAAGGAARSTATRAAANAGRRGFLSRWGGRAAMVGGAAALLSGGGEEGEEQQNASAGTGTAGGAGAAGFGPGGMAGSAARSGMASGGGSLPSVRPASRPSVSVSMGTNRLLVVAINYLSSIDATLKNQLETDRHIYQQDSLATRETGLEGGPQESAGLLSGIMPNMGKMRNSLLDNILEFLKIAGLLALPAAVSALKGAYDAISGFLEDTVNYVEEVAAGFGNMVDDIGNSISDIGEYVFGVGAPAPNPNQVDAVPAGGEDFAMASDFTPDQMKILSNSGVEQRGDMLFTEEEGMLTTQQVETMLGNRISQNRNIQSTAEFFTKGITKTAGLTLLKKIPGIGFMVGLGLATLRAKRGDYIGAGLELLSGIVSLAPGLGTAASFLIDAGILARDYFSGDGNTIPTDSATGSPSRTNAPPANPETTRIQTAAAKNIASAVLGENASFTSTFGRRTDPVDGTRGRMHTGYDFAASTGTPVKSYKGGKVTFAGRRGGYGNRVEVTTEDGAVMSYSHLSSIDVSVGDQVSAGQQLGKVGSTGRSTGAHLHFEIEQNGRKIDPASYSDAKMVPPKPDDVAKQVEAAKEDSVNVPAPEPTALAARMPSGQRSPMQNAGNVPSFGASQILDYQELFASA